MSKLRTTSGGRCFICLRQTEVFTFATSFTDKSKSVIYARFPILASRYLNLSSDFSNLEETINHSKRRQKKALSDENLLCDECLPLAESFCQKYDLWLSIQQEMNRCVEEIAARTRIELKFEQQQDVLKHENARRIRRSGHRSANLSVKTFEDFKTEFLVEVAKKNVKVYSEDEEDVPLIQDPLSQDDTVPFWSENKEEWTQMDPTTTTWSLGEEGTMLEHTEVKQVDFFGYAEGVDSWNSNCLSDKQLKLICRYCGKKLRDPSNRRRHEKKMHERFQDGNCIITGERQLDRSNVEMYVKCLFCNKTLASPVTLENHLRTHIGEKPFACKSCERTFYSQRARYDHMRTHMSSLPSGSRKMIFQCEFCPKQFYTKNVFQDHVRVHNPDDKPFQCTQCGRCFNQISNFRKHERQHSGIEPYKCGICGKGFKDPSNRRRHERKVHKSGNAASLH